MVRAGLIERAGFWICIGTADQYTVLVLAVHHRTKEGQAVAYVALSDAGGSRYSKIIEPPNCVNGPAMILAASNSSIVGSAFFGDIFSIALELGCSAIEYPFGKYGFQGHVIDNCVAPR